MAVKDATSPVPQADGGIGSSTKKRSPLDYPATLKLEKIDPSRERYPFCVVWTPIPLLSWIFPMIGHMGVCDSQGIIHDFGGSYFISKDAMLFGDPVKYWDLSGYILPKKELQVLCGHDHESSVRMWDNALNGTTEFFQQTQSYNFFTNNCHSFVACVMEAAGIQRSKWNMVKLTLCVMVYGRYVSVGRFVKAHLPFIVICCVVLSIAFGKTYA